jgi:type VI secretion system protein ImpH
VGPLEYEQFKRFLPGRRERTILESIIREYIGFNLTFDIDLELLPRHIPSCVLSGIEGSAIGENTWLN